MRFHRNKAGQFVKRNPGPKGPAKTKALAAAYGRAVRSTRADDSPQSHLGGLQRALIRRRIVERKRASRRNPGAKGKAKAAALIRAYSGAVGTMSGGRRSQRLHEALRRGERLGQVRRKPTKWVTRANPRKRRRNPSPALMAGLNATNPSRKARKMARRRRRTAAQRAAFRRMIAGLKRSRKGSSKRRRRHRKGAPTMARRRTRRRRAAVRMVNPPRRHRRRRRGFHPRRRRHYSRARRSNPGPGGIKQAARGVFMAAIPALGGGFVANFIDTKFLSDKHVVIRVGAKVVEAAVAAALLRRRPAAAFATMGAILGSIGGDFGTRVAGGIIVGASPVAKAQGVSALITEDPRTMGVLVEGMRGMGYQLDSNVSLGDAQALTPGTYQDVNLG